MTAREGGASPRTWSGRSSAASASALRTLFDADIETEARDVAEGIDLSLRLFRFATLPFGQHVERLPIPVVRRMRLFIYEMIRTRRASCADRGDLLSMRSCPARTMS